MASLPFVQLPYTLVRSLTVQFDNVDVFCERGVFEVDATKRILLKAKELGYRLNFHAEELSRIKGVEVRSRNCSLLGFGLQIESGPILFSHTGGKY